MLFFVPTFFSGMVSPYCVRLLVDDEQSSGRRAGQLYFVSTFGSAAGTILTSFYLVLWLEVNTILLWMIGISAALANGWQPFFNVDMLTGSDDVERTRVTLGVRVEL